MIEEGLFDRLKADSALRALINERVYALLAPQRVDAPFVVFSKISDVVGGTYCAQDLMTEAVYQFDSYAKSYKEALQVAEALKDCLIDFRGAMGGTHVASIRQEGEVQLLDPEPGYFRVSTSLVIWHSKGD